MKLEPKENMKPLEQKPHALLLSGHALLCKELTELEQIRIISAIFVQLCKSLQVF